MQEPIGKINVQEEKKQPTVWDCESSLYDSFELKSFERQLDSAIITSTRSISMPHLTERRITLRQPQPPPQQPQLSQQTMLSSKKTSRISRSLYKLIRSVFKTNKPNNNNVPAYQISRNNLRSSSERLFAIYDDRRRNGEVLTTIPEGPEFDIGLSPEIRSLVTRTSSDRFSASSIGISCA
ncbi:hypothetical protein LIER_35940 [Lithospermum erythrorhizon]|uniref:Uncharacterized protein n=1 Tax=Lithospermum erythrorhizon TaxID=34254 RepID=A0AAV3P0D0_LITER